MKLEVVNPESLGIPKGWSHGILAPRAGRILFVAGQAGWDRDAAAAPGPPSVPGFVEQFTRALDRVIEVVRQAGGTAEDIARMTVYVTDLEAYRAARKGIGEVWRARFGRYFPAMALLEVKGLVDEGAVVEIEATAVVADGGR